MNLLLDTHAFMWFVNGDPMLGDGAKKSIESIDNKNFVSVASLWEIAIKINIGKLSLVVIFLFFMPLALCNLNLFTYLPKKIF